MTVTKKSIDKMPKATLKNGLIVYNFSIGEDITFDDGTKLKGCSKRRIELLEVESNKLITKNDQCGIDKIKNVIITYNDSNDYLEEMLKYSKIQENNIIIILSDIHYKRLIFTIRKVLKLNDNTSTTLATLSYKALMLNFRVLIEDDNSITSSTKFGIII